MVEMLGVLAIIGVLSIGGIAGYTLSMRRYRANIVLDTLNKYSLILYSSCQKAIVDGEIQTFTDCVSVIGNELPSLSDTDLNASKDITGNMGRWTVQENGKDYIHFEIEFVDNEICKATRSILGSMPRNDCIHSNKWLSIKIPQN